MMQTISRERKTKLGSVFCNIFFFALVVFSAIALSVAVVATLPNSAYAVKTSNGAKCHAISSGTVYNQYDVTGDRKADTVYIYLGRDSSYSYSSIYVYINQKLAFHSNTNFYYLAAQLITLKNGKAFLYLKASGDNDDADICGIYKVSNDKLKQIVDCNKGFGKKVGSHTGGEITKVSGNAMKVRFSVMAFMSGRTEAEYTYKYKSGTLKKIGKIGKLYVGSRKSNTYKAKKSITAYTSTKCNHKKFKIRMKQNVKFLAAYVNGNTVRYRVKAGKKIGWIKVANSYNSPLMYKNWTTPDFYIYEPPFEGTFLAG